MRGFTLIELLIAMAIVGILLSVAVPSYQSHRLKVVQSQGMVALQQLAQRQARLRLDRGTFETASGLLALGSLPKAVTSHYRLAVEIGDHGASYIMRLVPKSRGAEDPVLSLDSIGRRLPARLWF